MIRNQDLVTSLIVASEKAARIARICRQNEYLLKLLVEEKPKVDIRSTFVRDFKTLADVLVQQSIKYDLEREYPALKNRIYGEESESFTNTNGNSIRIELNESKTNTLHLLNEVLDGNNTAANLLAECVHSQICINDVTVQSLPFECGELVAEELALWIDPIDSTTEYISGENTNNYIDDSKNIPLNGLNCVTVLIGVFYRSTGIPIIGVLNQPFYTKAEKEWQGRCFWGLCYENNRFSCIPSRPLSATDDLIIAVSAFEQPENRKKLEEAGFLVLSPAGAGFKILCVILGYVSAYVLSFGSTYYWDTCGCHAILKSLGGNIWNYQEAVKGDNLDSIYYKEKQDKSNVKLYSNKCGIIASKDDKLARRIVEILKQD